MAFDREKYRKQVSVEDIDSNLKKAQDTMKNPMFSGQGGRASFFSVAKEGRYVLRVLPSKTGRPYIPRKTVKLPVECPVYNSNGEDTGKKEVKMKDIFTSDIHSERMGGKDAVLTYIDYVYELASEIQDADERKKFLAPINGYRNKQKQWVWGISAQLNYVCYVYAENEIHRFDIRPQWWKELKKISIERCDDDVLSIDIFSDYEKGYPLIVNTSLNDKNKLEFALSCDLPKVGENWDEFFEKNIVSDEVLESLEELPKLEDMYVDVFSRKDWNLQIEGLERIDEQYKFGIFQNDQFLDELEEIEKLVPEDDEVKEAAQIPTKKEQPVKSKPEPARTKKKEESTSTYPPLIKMKLELKEYIEREYEDTEELPSDLSVTELRKWYDLMKEGKMLPFDDYREEPSDDDYPSNDEPQEDDEPAPIDESKTTKISSKSSVSSKLQALRNRTKRK